MQERGGQNPDGNRSVESGTCKEAGAHLDCGRSAEAPRAGRRPGRQRAAGAPGHSAPGPGSHAAGTAPCHWRDRVPRQEGHLLALPNTHSTQHPGPPAAWCPPALPRPARPSSNPRPIPLCSFADSSALCALIPLGWLALQAQDSPTSGKQEEEHLELLALRQQSHEVKTERDLVDTGVSSLVQPWEGSG